MTLTCLITGSSRGIGLAIAHHLAAKGHRVILNSRSPIAPEILAQFDGYEQPVLQATGDISKFDVAKQLVDDLYDQGVQVDVLVNNAGITRDGLVMRMSEEDFNAVRQQYAREVVAAQMEEAGGYRQNVDPHELEKLVKKRVVFA